MENNNKEPKKEKHICCDGECNHDDCCGKIPENCPNFSTPPPSLREEWWTLENLMHDYGNACVRADSGDAEAKTQEGIIIEQVKTLLKETIKRDREELLSEIETEVWKLPMSANNFDETSRNALLEIIKSKREEK